MMNIKIIILLFAPLIFVGKVQSQIHEYDDFNRLLSVIYPDGSQITYQYDKLGNRIGYTVQSARILLSPKVYLMGAFEDSDGLMRDALRNNAAIPTTEPYTIIGYQHQGDQGGGELISDSTNILSDRGPNSVVDWVLIELRDQSDISVILHSRAALLLRNGDITDMDGVSPVGFRGVNSDNYFIAIRHRNHLAVATKNPTNLAVGTTNTVDFTNSSTLTYGTNAQIQLSSGLMAMVSGDANGDGSVNAVDKNTHWRPQNGQSFNYLSSNADFNLDGAVNAIDQNLHWRINNSKTQNF